MKDFIEALIAVAFGVIIFTVAIFTLPLLGVAVGAFVGWLVGLVFDGTMAKMSTLLGGGWEPYQIGAMLGFAGGFFSRSSASSKSD